MATRPATLTVWNGTAEVPATVKVWDGSTEVAVTSLEVVIDDVVVEGGVLSNTAEGGTNSTPVSVANTGGASGDAFTTADASIVFSTAAAHSGFMGYLLPTAAVQSQLVWTLGSSTSCAAQMWFKLTAAPTTGEARVLSFRDTTPATVGGLLVNTDRTVSLMQLTSSIGATKSPALTLNAWYRLDIAIKNGTAGTGTYSITITTAAGALFHSYSGAFSGTAAAITTVRFGRPSTSDVQGHFDDMKAEPGRSTVIGDGTPVVDVKPGPTNTGHTGALTSYTGPTTITVAGTLIENKEITANLVISAANVTIRNCYLRGGATAGTLISCFGTAVSNLLVEYCTLAPDVVGLGSQGMHGHDYTVRFCDVSRVVDGFGCFYPSPNSSNRTANVLIEKNWVHDLHCMLDAADQLGITHNDCVQIHGSGGVHIIGNTLSANPGPTSNLTTSPQGTITGGMAGVMMTPSNTYGQDARDVVIEDNWFDYGTACLNLNRGNTSALTQVIVRNNKFGRNGPRTGTTAMRATVHYSLDAPGLPLSTGPDTAGNVYEDTGLPITVNISGSYAKPSAANTGTLATPALTALAGDQTITVNGTILKDKDITGRVIVQANNVSIRNCRIRGGAAPGGTNNYGLISAYYPGTVGLVVEDCILVPDNVAVGWTGILGHDYTVSRTEVYNTVDGFGVYNTAIPDGPTNVTIEACYVHDLAYIDPDPNQPDGHTHNDCVQIQGGSHIKLLANTLMANASTTVGTPAKIPAGYAPSVTGQAIGVTTAVGQTTDLTIDRNWLDYGAQSLIVLQKAALTATTALIVRNKFGRNQVNLPREGVTARWPIVLDPDLVFPGMPVATGPDTTNGNVYEDTGAAITVNRSGVAPVWSTNGLPLAGQVLLGHDTFTDGTSPLASMLTAEAMTGVKAAVHRIYAGDPQYTPSSGAQTGIGSSILTNIAGSHAAGRIPWYSFKMPKSASGTAYTWAQVTAGQADAWVNALVNALNSVTTGPVWVAFHHEPDGDQAIADFRALTRYLMPKITNPRVMKWVILAGWGATHSGSPSWEEGYPGDGYIDAMGFDPYNTHASTLGSAWVEFGSSSPNYFPGIQAWCNTHPAGRARDGGKIVWGVAETGWTNDAFDGYNTTDNTSPLGDSRLWYTRQVQNLKTYGGIAMAYFTYSGAVNTWSWSANQAKATKVGEAETAHGSYYPF